MYIEVGCDVDVYGLCEANNSTNEHTQNVALVLVGRHDSGVVGGDDDHGTDVVGDDSHGTSGVVGVFFARESADFVDDGTPNFGLVVVVFSLKNGGDSLDSHACIDVFL